MTETERPSVERVLEWAHNVRDSVFLLDFWVSVYQKSWNRKMFQGLIEAAEKWLNFTRAHPMTATEAELMREAEFHTKHYATLKSKVLEQEMEANEKDRRIEELENKINAQKRRIYSLETKYGDRTGEPTKSLNYHRSRNLELKKNRKELSRLVLNLRSQLVEKEQELERLRDEVDELRLIATPGFIKAVRKWIFKTDEDIPSETEVEKVAEKLYQEMYPPSDTRPGDAVPPAWAELGDLFQSRYRSVAHHLLAYGYRAEK